MNNNYFFNLFILLFSLGNNGFAQSEKVNLPTFSITVPDGMKNHPNDLDVLVKLSFENSLHITIDDNIEKMLSSSKKNPMGKTLNMEEFAFKLKFDAIKNQYKGYDVSKKKTGTLKKIKYTAQMFTCKATKTQEAYLEYRVMEIEGRHYEFIITGKKDLKKKHQPLITNFWKSISPNKK
jgi:hypothetical protein